MSCNHTKKSISKHEILAPVRVLHLLECPPQTAEGKKMEGNMPSMDTLTQITKPGFYV
jgi:hypothetical protein